MRLRLTSGLSVATATTDVQALTRFSEFLAAAPEVAGLAAVDRALPERYLAWLTTQPGGLSAQEGRVNGLYLSSRGSASTAGTTRCPPPRCSSPGTVRGAGRRWPVTSPST